MCALECCIRTGIEGHEWEFKSSPGGSKDCKYPAVAGNLDLQSSNEDSVSDESVQQKPQKRMRTNANRFFESDSDEDEVKKTTMMVMEKLA